MCELAFIEYNPTFDLIMPFACFFDVTRKTSVIFNNCHSLMTLMIGLHHFLEMSKKCWPRLRVRNSIVGCRKTGKENFLNVNLVLSICQLNVYLTIPISNNF
jgi:hypothetical protein